MPRVVQNCTTPQDRVLKAFVYSRNKMDGFESELMFETIVKIYVIMIALQGCYEQLETFDLDIGISL